MDTVEQQWQRNGAAAGVRTYINSQRIGSDEFPAAGTKLVKLFRRMVLTGKPPILYEQMLEWVKITQACRSAQDTHKRVYLNRIR